MNVLVRSVTRSESTTSRLESSNEALAKEARTTDVNGGCRYVTAWLREADGSSMVRSGPTTNVYAIAVDSNSGDRQGKGQVTTWEHEWFQYYGWVDD